MALVGPLLVGGTIEVGQDVPDSAFESPAQHHELVQTPRSARGGQRVNFSFHSGLVQARIGRAVAFNDVSFGAPGDLKGDVLLASKQVA